MAAFALGPQQARRRQRRWQIGLGLLTILELPLLFWWLIASAGAGADEVLEMGPWPDPKTEPAALVPAEMGDLGVGRARTAPARDSDTMWSDGFYNSGVVAEYGLDDRPALWLAVLRYDTPEDAAAEFDVMSSWAEQYCAQYTWSTQGTAALVTCGMPDGHKKTFRQDSWIVDIAATIAAPVPPRQLVDDARDAIAQHWKTLQ